MADDPKKGSTLRSFGQVEQMIQLALSLPIGCLVGWWLGSLADKHFGLTWCGLAGIGLGAVAGFIQVFTTAQRILNKGK